MYADNLELIHRQRISNKAIVFYLSLDEQHLIKHLLFVAESLGTIPPCTGIMVLTTKRKSYEVNLRVIIIKMHR